MICAARSFSVSGLMGLTIGLMALFMAGCSNNPVHSDYDPEVNFAEYKSYYLLPYRQSANKAVEITEMELDRTESALKKVFAQRFDAVNGMSRADVVLSYYLVVEPSYTYTTHGTATSRFYSEPGGSWNARFKEKVYPKGMLIVDLYDAGSGKMVWRGSVDTKLSHKHSPQERQEKLRQAAEKLLASLPKT